MREILFRGKRSYNSEWIYGNLVIDAYGKSHIVPNAFFVEDGHHLRYEDDTDKPVFFNLDTLGQFTGLKDKNGVRIFEGDIVKHYKIIDDYDIGHIYWNNKTSSFRRTSLWLNSQSLPLDYSLDVNCEYEVIGNIYDNPELLEEGESK